MRTLTLMAASLLLAACSTPEQHLVGGDRDSHGCIGSAGYQWSALTKQCVRLFEQGIRLNPTDAGQTSSAFVLFNADQSKAELTLLDHASKSRLALTQDPAAPAGQPTSSKAKDGYIWLHFTAPGISDRVHYRLDHARQPLAPIWLNYDWDRSGVADVDDLSGWAFFNQWRSSDRVIYRRELLQ